MPWASTSSLTPENRARRRDGQVQQLLSLQVPRSRDRIDALLALASTHDVQVAAIAHVPSARPTKRSLREAERYAARKLHRRFKKLLWPGTEYQFDPRAVTKVFADAGVLVGYEFRDECNRCIGRTEEGVVATARSGEGTPWTGSGLRPWDNSWGGGGWGSGSNTDGADADGAACAGAGETWGGGHGGWGPGAWGSGETWGSGDGSGSGDVDDDAAQ
ncbi:hypothetical protein C8R47DRAFT_1218993 [Mycena vitilis]|nr:hypothetical protein C8R47DRAFT_1218993 [Mycena vitilis]